MVFNAEGKPVAVLDSESEAYWFTKNRGHAARYSKAPLDYAAAPELLAALEAALKYLEANRPKGKIQNIFATLNEH